MIKFRRAMVAAKLNVERSFYRHKAKKSKAKGNLDNVRRWNDEAYKCDKQYMEVMEK